MSEALIGKELLGQFKIVSRIGRGGMGEVYKAEQPAMDRLVAIKILHSKLAQRQDLVSRFRREARAMSRLTHPNTARVFLYGHLEETNQLYIVMEFLDGSDLARLVRRQGPMTAERGIKVMIQVLGALEEAHTSGIVHRDLKPENILLTTQGGISDFPKVLDFGLAKIRETKLRPGSLVLTQEGMVFGTPEFMSPEQARGETLDARTDVYSAALIFYELITGKLPFPKGKPMEYISHQIYTPPIPISERTDGLDVPKALDQIIGKALEKDKDNRYNSAREFAEALRTLLPSASNSLSARALPDDLPSQRIDDTRSTQSARPQDFQQVPQEKPTIGAGKPLIAGMGIIILVLIGLICWLLVLQQPVPTPVSVPPIPEPSESLDTPSAAVVPNSDQF